MYTIYALRDPANGRDRYIGSTKQPMQQRLMAHVWEAQSYHFSQTPKRVWLRSLSDRGVLPIIAGIDEAQDRSAAMAIELWWLDWKRRQGEDLLNWDTGPYAHLAP